jgi:predicted signal transduction protein with EAL and GGDEF domain
VGGRLVGRVWSFRDVTQRLASERRLAYLANYDPLTQLPNRNLLQDRLQHAILQAARDGQRLAVLFLDLDNFKYINDTLGHAVGDRVLEETATRLTGLLPQVGHHRAPRRRRVHAAARGPGPPGRGGAGRQSLINSLSRPFVVEGREVFCSASIGIAVYPSDADNIEDLMKNADAAMYRAKEQGRSHYQFFTADLNRRADGAPHPRQAACAGAGARGEFELHYQPQLDLRTRSRRGGRGALRWKHPELGIVLPGEFIPMLEETGMIVPVAIGCCARRACSTPRVGGRGVGPLRMSVNVSIRQFRQARFPEYVSGVLAETGLDPRFLEMEITESVLAEGPTWTRRSLERLQEPGGAPGDRRLRHGLLVAGATSSASPSTRSRSTSLSSATSSRTRTTRRSPRR